MNPLLQRIALPALRSPARRGFASVSPLRNHKIVVIGSGSAGIALSHQLLRKGKFAKHDIAVIDPATWHHYQPGWTLVGGGISSKKDFQRPMEQLIDPNLKFYNQAVASINPKEQYVSLRDGEKIIYDQVVIVPGIKVDYDSVKGLTSALADPDSPVASIYSYDHCDKAFQNIQRMNHGDAIFTQPLGVVKCAGAPQKIMWLALDYWRRAGLYNYDSAQSRIQVTFATGLPTMFGVPKYNAKLEQLRQERGVEGLFEHNLVSIDRDIANFNRPGGKGQVQRQFKFLHVAPRNIPHAFVGDSGLGNDTGFVDVDEYTLRHKIYKNVWSMGDAAALPTSKTVAAITSQAPILTQNLLLALEGKEPALNYDGYTSCPLLTGDKQVLLAEFKYGNIPKETFNQWLGIDQSHPRRLFYHLKKDFFPWVYSRYHVKGQWGGPQGLIR